MRRGLYSDLNRLAAENAMMQRAQGSFRMFCFVRARNSGRRRAARSHPRKRANK